ncbi:MAG: PIN domain-containing protein, partial [Deferrisomatales bacterium]
MSGRILVDTDVCIDYLRGRPEAVDWLESTSDRLLVSAVTVAELFAGVREGSERGQLKEFLRAFVVVPVDDRIAEQGGRYRRDYRRSHATELADALIVATAATSGAALATLNE